MMRSDQLNRHDHGSYIKITALSLNINVTDKDGSKQIIVHKTLLENSSTDISGSEGKIVNKTLSQKNLANISEYSLTELKEKKN